jgi:uncharacterized membrane protein YkoI
MTKLFRLTALSICTFAGLAAFSSAKADNDHKQYSGTKIGMQQAVKIAEDHVGGKAIDADFDSSDDDNNNGPVYEIEVIKDDIEHEVKIDAASGTILKVDIDD